MDLLAWGFAGMALALILTGIPMMILLGGGVMLLITAVAVLSG